MSDVDAIPNTPEQRYQYDERIETHSDYVLRCETILWDGETLVVPPCRVTVTGDADTVYVAETDRATFLSPGSDGSVYVDIDPAAEDAEIVFQSSAPADPALAIADFNVSTGAVAERNRQPSVGSEFNPVENAYIDRATLRSQSGAQLPRRDGRTGSNAGIAAHDYQPSQGLQAYPIHTINPTSDLTISTDSFSSSTQYKSRFPLNYMGTDKGPIYAGLVGYIRGSESGQELNVEIRTEGQPNEEPYGTYVRWDASSSGHFISDVVEVSADTPSYQGAFRTNGVSIKMKKQYSTLSDVDIAPGMSICLWREH